MRLLRGSFASLWRRVYSVLKWQVTSTIRQLILVLIGAIPRGRLLPHRTLVIVHVGKCGGRSLKKAIRRSVRMALRYSSIETWHTLSSVFPDGDEYVVVLRSPIRRALSAFDYRYKQVISKGTDPRIFPGEEAALSRWSDFNSLAEALYRDGKAVESAMHDFSAVHHLGDETLHQYLDNLDTAVEQQKPITCIVTENLSEESKKFLRLRVGKSHQGVSFAVAPPVLTETAKENLRRKFASDYRALERLHHAGVLSRAQWLMCNSD